MRQFVNNDVSKDFQIVNVKLKLSILLTSCSIFVLGSSLLVSLALVFRRVKLVRMTKYPIRCTFQVIVL